MDETKHKSPFKAILFDWDGCLVDSSQLWIQAFVEVCQARQIEISEADIIAKLLGSWTGPAKIGVTDVDVFMKEVVTIGEKLLENVPLQPYAAESLTWLVENNYRLAIVSSSTRQSLMVAIEKLGIKNLFGAILAKEDVAKTKPDPEIVYLAMQKLGVLSTETIIIGDSGKDIQAGKAAGVETILYYPAHHHKLHTEAEMLELGADHMLRDFQELRTLLENPTATTA